MALAPLLLALTGRLDRGRPTGLPAARAWTLGLVTGGLFFGGTLYWVAAMDAVPAAASAGAALVLVAYLTIYPALAAVCIARLVRGFGAAGVLLAPAPWVAAEYLRGTLFGGFPWLPLGGSQAHVLPVVQLASLTGVYGLSALVACVSAVLVYAAIVPRRRALAAIVPAGVLLAAAAAWGTWRVADGALTRDGDPLRVGIVQPNIAQPDKWDPRAAWRIVTTHVSLTREAAGAGAAIVVWPESSTPFRFESDEEGTDLVRDLAREIGTPILVGSDETDARDPRRVYNAAFLVGADGATDAVYRKQRLVPFGEYVPFGRLLSGMAPVIQTDGAYVPGDATVLFHAGGRAMSTAICYESVYPAIARGAVLAGSTLLVTITNDAWYDRTAAPFQHAALASLRAVEQGRYLVRAANTGISGVVDPYGRVVRSTALRQSAVLVEDVRLLTGRTVYAVVGDVAAQTAIVVTILAWAAAWAGGSRSRVQVTPTLTGGDSGASGGSGSTLRRSRPPRGGTAEASLTMPGSMKS